MQNVLTAISFNLKFTYVLAGWEGSAHDSRVLNDASVLLVGVTLLRKLWRRRRQLSRGDRKSVV